MAADPLSTVYEKLTEMFVSYSIDFIKRQFNYMFRYKKNIENLTDECKNLDNMKHEVERRKIADENNLRPIGSGVEQWIKDAEDVIAQADEVLQGRAAVEKGCLYGKCPNCWSRYSLSRKAVKTTNDVNERKTKGKEYIKFSYDPVPTGMASASSTQAFERFESRELQMQEVMEALKGDQINVIGICGMAGVGKTTMVKKLKDRALYEKLCNSFTMADVTKENPDPKRIQSELASMLGLDLKDEPSKYERANKLRRRLSNGDRIIVVLDDVWGRLDLSELGVPHKSKECKVILTSRMTNVCNSTGAQKVFELGLLTEEEAWDLFMETVGAIDENSELYSTAKDVAKKCQQLPLAIKVVGGALGKNRELPIWRNALRELRNAPVKNILGVSTELYSSIKLSYNLLESDQAQSLLLLCSLFPEDFDVQVECLVRYLMGLPVFKGVGSLAERRDLIDTLVDRLKVHHLLLPKINQDFVKLHDVVRDFCISVASESGQFFLQRLVGEMEDGTEEDLHKYYTSISLKADFLHLIPIEKICSTLEVLQVLQGDGRPVKVFQVPQGDGRPVISAELFTGMQVLKVLDLRGIESSEAEQDFSPLVNLKTLCLHNCFFGSKITIGNLHNLEILSFYDSRLRELPSEIGQLSNLKLLDLRFIKSEKPHELPPGIFLGLKKLEELYLGDYFQTRWDKQGTKSFHESMAELSSLSRLTTFQVSTRDIDRLKVFEGLRFEQLSRFEIIVSTRHRYLRTYQIRKKWELDNFHLSVLSIKLIQALLKRTEDADFCLKGMKCFTELKESNGFIDLKSLRLDACEDMEYLIDTVSNRVTDNPFENLKSLKLVRMESFKEICRGNLPGGSFSRLQELSLDQLPCMTHLWRGFVQLPCLSNLEVINVTRCGAIKSLFPISVVTCLLKLRGLSIEKCEMMEEIILKEQGENEDTKMIEFPRLAYLTIEDLPNLKSFSTKLGIHCLDTSHELNLQPVLSKQVILPRLETVDIVCLEKIVQIVDDRMETGSLDRLKYMDVTSCNSLLNIASSDSIKRLHKLEVLKIEFCSSLKSVFDFEHIKFCSGNPEVILNEMKSIDLWGLPELIHIWRMVPTEIQAFQNLRSIKLGFCSSLRCLFSPPVANMLVNLRDLELRSCEMMEALIKIEENSSRINMVEDSGSKAEDADEALGTDKENGFPRLSRIISPCCMPKKLLQRSKGARMEDNAGTVEEKAISNDAAKGHEKIVLPGLKVLHLGGLENLEMFCSSELAVELPLLEKVWLNDCTKLKTFCAGPLSTPKLRKVLLPNGQWMNDDNSALKHIGERQNSSLVRLCHTLPEKTEDKVECGSSEVSTHSEIEPAE